MSDFSQKSYYGVISTGFIIFALFALFALLWTQAAFAQRLDDTGLIDLQQPRQQENMASRRNDAMPAGEPPPVIDLRAALGEDMPNISFGESNEYFQRLMQIQHQIALLTSLNERQRQVDQMRATFRSMGLPFTAPPPNRGACAQLPPNPICARAYPGIYDDYTKRRIQPPEPEQTFEELLAESMQETLQKELAGIESDDIAPSEPKARVPNFYWSDIACRVGQCRAIIARAGNPTETRRTVKIGDEVENGYIVTSIGIDGVGINHPEHGDFVLEAFDQSMDVSPRALMSQRREADSAGRADRRQQAPVGNRPTVGDERTSLDEVDPIFDDEVLDQTVGGLIGELGRLGESIQPVQPPPSVEREDQQSQQLGFD